MLGWTLIREDLREALWREGWDRGDGVGKAGGHESALHGSIQKDR
jgi:hypothetical protein